MALKFEDIKVGDVLVSIATNIEYEVVGIKDSTIFTGSERHGFWQVNVFTKEAFATVRYILKPRQHDGWINIYKNGLGNLHDTRQDADQAANPGDPRIACIKISYTEGEGL